MELTEAQLRRYSPQMALGAIGARGQKALLEGRVCLVGAGGIGCATANYLAAAGVGRIGIIDDDHIELSNLQRQVLYGEKHLGKLKAEEACAVLAARNPDIQMKSHLARLSAHNIEDIFAPYDIIADCSDNIATRLLVNDACFFMKKILVSAAASRFGGLLSNFHAFEKDAEGTPFPSYRCLVGDGRGLSDRACAEEGILGAVCGVMGAWQAMEIIKEMTGAGKSLAGRLLIYDALEPSMRIARLAWDEENPLNGKNPTIKDLSPHIS